MRLEDAQHSTQKKSYNHCNNFEAIQLKGKKKKLHSAASNACPSSYGRALQDKSEQKSVPHCLRQSQP